MNETWRGMHDRVAKLLGHKDFILGIEADMDSITWSINVDKVVDALGDSLDEALVEARRQLQANAEEVHSAGLRVSREGDTVTVYTDTGHVDLLLVCHECKATLQPIDHKCEEAPNG